MKSKSRSSVRVTWLALGLLFPLLALSGCVGRTEAVLVTTRLGEASKETEKLVTQLKAADAANIAALEEYQSAFLNLQRERALDKIALSEARFLKTIEGKTAAFLAALPAEQTRFMDSFAAEFTKQTAPLLEIEKRLLEDVEKARKASDALPGDKDLKAVWIRVDAQFLAFQLARLELVAKVSNQAYAQAERQISAQAAAVVKLAADASAQVTARAASAVARINESQPSIPRLPAPGAQAYDAVSGYVKAVQASSDSFAKYLQSNSLATDSFAGSFVSGFGENVVGAVTGALRGDVPRAADVAKEGMTLGRGLWNDLLADTDLNGRALLDKLDADVKKAGPELTQIARDQARIYLADKLPAFFGVNPPAKADGKN